LLHVCEALGNGRTTVVQTITGDMKVADIIRRWPQTDEVFSKRGCRDLLAGFTGRIMTLRNAARLQGIDLAPLLEELNRAAASTPPAKR
jgi:Domain of unknown function (DUF1858)